MRPGLPDATAHQNRLWPQSLYCLTDLPRLWDVVMAIGSLTSPALPLPQRASACLRGTAAQPGPRGRSRSPASDRFSTCASGKTSPLRWTVALRARGWKWLGEAGKCHRHEWSFPTMGLLRIFLKLYSSQIYSSLSMIRARSFLGGHLSGGPFAPQMGLAQARITRSRGP